MVFIGLKGTVSVYITHLCALVMPGVAETEMKTTCHKIHRNQKKNMGVPTTEILCLHLLSDFTKNLNKIKGVQCPHFLININKDLDI